MSDTRMFHIGDILTITTGYLVSPEHVDGVYKILEYMTGEAPFTHQLPRFAKECKPYLKEAFPQFDGIDCSGITPENWEEWLDNVTTKYGPFHAVRPIGAEDHEQKSPIQELIDMGVSPSKVVVVHVDTKESES